MDTDLSTATTDELMAELRRRHETLVVIGVPKNEPTAFYTRVDGDRLRILGLLTMLRRKCIREIDAGFDGAQKHWGKQ